MQGIYQNIYVEITLKESRWNLYISLYTQCNIILEYLYVLNYDISNRNNFKTYQNMCGMAI